MRKFIMVFIIFVLFNTNYISCYSNSSELSEQFFKDVNKDDWYFGAINELNKIGGVSGFEDGTFKPNNKMTVAEFLAILLASNGFKQESGQSSWYSSYVNKSIELNLIDLNEVDNYYIYEKEIFRKDIAKIVYRFLKINNELNEDNIFIDVGAEGSRFINSLFEEYLVRGYYEDGERKFKPYGLATRAEVSAIILNIIEYRKDRNGYINKQKKYFSEIEFTLSRFQSSMGINFRYANENSELYYIDYSNRKIELILNTVKNLDLQKYEVINVLKQKFEEKVINEISKLIDSKEKANDKIEEVYSNEKNDLYIKIRSMKDSVFVSVVITSIMPKELIEFQIPNKSRDEYIDEISRKSFIDDLYNIYYGKYSTDFLIQKSNNIINNKYINKLGESLDLNLFLERDYIQNPWERFIFYNNDKEYITHNFNIIATKNLNINKLLIDSIERGISEDGNYLLSKNIDIDWISEIFILQPPTKNNWGLGYLFYYDESNNINYVEVPMAPFENIVDYKISLEFTLGEDLYDNVYEAIVKVERLDDSILGEINPKVQLEFEKSEILDVVGKEFNKFENGAWFLSENLNKDKNYTSYKIIFKTNDEVKNIRIKSSINMVDGLFEYNEIYEEDNIWDLEVSNEVINYFKELNSIEKVSESDDLSTEYKSDDNFILDYDEYERAIEYHINKGSPLIASLELPKSNNNNYYFWAGNKTEGNFILNIKPVNSIFENIKKYGLEKLTSEEKFKTRIERNIGFKAILSRKAFGDKLLNGDYALNNDNEVKKINIDISDSYISRNYSKFLKDSKSGALKLIEEKKIYSDFLPSAKKDLELVARIYNGSELSTNKTVYEGEIDTGSSNLKKIIWKGRQFDIPVQRVMKIIDNNGEVEKLIAIDGKYLRDFQQVDVADVKYVAIESFKDNFVDNKELEVGLTPHSVYSAKVRTSMYVKLGEETQHKDIVKSVINSFEIKNTIPFIDSFGNKTNFIPIDYNVRYNVILDTELKYDTAPLNDIEKYLYGDEEELLINTDRLYRELLEGYSYCLDEKGKLSWDKYKYREFIKGSSIRNVVEESLIEFIVNPNMDKYELDFKDEESNYYIDVNFNEFNNSFSENYTKTGSSYNIDSIKFIKGDEGNSFILEEDIEDDIEEDIVEEDLVEEDLVEEDIVEEDIVEEDIVEEDIVEEDIVEEDIVEEDIVEEEILEDDILEDDGDNIL